VTVGDGVGQVAEVDLAALASAIEVAEGIYSVKENQTQAQLDSATNVLENAINAFNEAIVKAGNATLLQGKIEEATVRLNEVTVGSGVGQVVEVDLAALASAIEKAEGI
ncbi:hypothetical protein, partial [Ureibacillus sinduriensis]|uniref:hypothetical protein n=1 Tax=Ureibacillus sinduriensis TaxID=561440 RepID=UPI000559F594